MYQPQGTCVSEHLAAREGFVRACTPSPARGASEGPVTGETGHGHKPEDINQEQGLSAFAPHCPPNPASCFSFSGTTFAVSPALLFQPPTSVSLPSIPCYGCHPQYSPEAAPSSRLLRKQISAAPPQRPRPSFLAWSQHGAREQSDLDPNCARKCPAELGQAPSFLTSAPSPAP